MSILCLVCLGCRQQNKEQQDPEPEAVHISITDETEAIIDNMVVPPKRRRSSWLASYSSVFGSESDSFSPPTACFPAGASSPNYIHPRPSSDPLYVESYPLCRPEPATQFKMDSCGGSTADEPSKQSGDFFHGRWSVPQYDVPISYKKSATGDEWDEVFISSSSGGRTDDQSYPLVTVHVENIEKYGDAFTDVKMTPEERNNLCKGRTLSKLNRAWPDVQEKRPCKSMGTPPLPRGSLKRMSIWNPLALPNEVSTCSTESSVQERGKDGLTPRPCSVPRYVNFKGCVNN